MRMVSKKTSYNITACIIAFGMQLTNVKIGPVQIMEFIFLLLGIWYLPKMHRLTRRFFLFYGIYLLVTFIHNPFLKFDYSMTDSFIKLPYWCSVGRFAELLACFSFVELSRKTMLKYGVGRIVLFPQIVR